MLNKPAILVFIDWYEPGYRAGGPVRSLVNLTDALSSRYHFYIVTSNTDYGQTKPYTGIETNVWISHKESVSVMYLENPGYKNIKDIIKKTPATVVYVQGMFSTQFSIYPLLAAKRLRVRTVVAVRGMMHASALTVKSRKKKIFIFLSKLAGFHKGIVLQANDDLEKQEILKNLGKKLTVEVAPNIPVQPIINIPDKVKEKGKLKVISVSRISSEKNNTMILECMKKISGTVEIDFYGADRQSEYANQFSKMIRNMPENIEAEKMGELKPEELQKVWEGYHLFFLPSLGENFGHAIYEAFANGLPVLISNNSPWKNLQAKKAGFDLPVSDRKEFVKALEFFMDMENEEYQEWSLGAAKVARDYYEGSHFEQSYARLFGC